jgi:hypothetical protein
MILSRKRISDMDFVQLVYSKRDAQKIKRKKEEKAFKPAS